MHSSKLDDPQVVAALADGAVVVLPTDTIYGLAADVRQPQAVATLYQLKSREHKPGTLIAASVQQLIELGLSSSDLQKVEHLWPNAISIVVPSPQRLAYVDQGVGSLAVRIPNDPAIQALLQQTGPLVTSSANDPGEPPANTIDEAWRYFGDRVPLYIDGGDRSNRPPSTVARLETDGSLTVLRQGAVTIN